MSKPKPKTRKLLPCPFCGAPAELREVTSSPPECPKSFYVIECKRSHPTTKHPNWCRVSLMTIGDTPQEAVNLWNHRA